MTDTTNVQVDLHITHTDNEKLRVSQMDTLSWLLQETRTMAEAVFQNAKIDPHEFIDLGRFMMEIMAEQRAVHAFFSEGTAEQTGDSEAARTRVAGAFDLAD